ncbi:putative elongator complex protein 1 [Coemansia sp. RSA 1813]|nr:putative elongator complex protein 1 [Coemansia sp. RSA 1813]
MPTILATFMCQTPADIASALQILAPLSTDERNDALMYLLFLSDAGTVYNAALGLYGLPLALPVAQHSQRGPCKYLVSLGALKAIRSKKHQHYNIGSRLNCICWALSACAKHMELMAHAGMRFTLGDIPEELDEGISFDSPSAGDGNCKAMERLSFTGSKNTHNTPMKLGSTDSRSMASKGYKKAELQSTRRREAEDMVDRYIKRDIRGLLDLAVPDDEDAKNAAGTLATSISILVEKLLSGGNRQLSYRSRSSSNNSRGSRGAATRRGGSGSRNTVAGKKSVSKPKNDSANITSDWITEQQNAQSTKGKPAKAPSRNSVAALSKSFDKFRQWVNSNNSTNESTLYEPISQFFCFVASYLKAVHTPSQSVCPRRLVVLFCKPNRKSADGDDSSRVDLYLNLLQFDDYTIGTLITNPPEEENEAPMLADTFAIVEVKSAI